MQRRISKGTYFVAAFITAAIFLIGLFLGLVIEGKRVFYVNDMFDTQKVEFSSSQLQYAYVTSLHTKDSCPAIFETFYNNLKQMDNTRQRVENYARDSKINDASFNLLKRKYTIEQIRYWLLAKQAQDICDEDIVRVLYFYSTDKECPSCADQGFVLDYLKGLFNEQLLIFALDSQFEEEPMIDVLVKRYNVNTYPTIVIEDEVLTGYNKKDLLMEKICYSIESEKCDEFLSAKEDEEKNNTEIELVEE